MTSKDRNKRTNINRKLLDKIFSALEGVNIKQSKFVSKNQKEIKPEDTMPFPRFCEQNFSVRKK